MTLLPPSRHPALRLPRPALVALLVGGLMFASSCGNDEGEGPPGVKDLIAVVSPPPSAVVGSSVHATIRALDENGHPVEGKSVFWTVLAGAGTVPDSGTTDSDGEVEVTWQLGTAPGINTLRALAPGADPISLNVTTTAGPIAQLTRLTAIQQGGLPGAPIAILPQVEAADVYGNLISGAKLAVTVTGNGIATPDTVTTDALGKAVISSWLLSTTPLITDTLRFKSVNNVTALFLAGIQNTGPVADSLEVVGVLPDSAAAGTTVQVRVRALDVDGDSLPGVTIIWSIQGGGGSIPLSSTTGGDGTSQVGWQLGTAIGIATLRVTAVGPAPVDLALYKKAGPVTTLQSLTPTLQSGVAGAPVLTLPKVKALDTFGNPAAHVPLAVSVTGDGVVSPDTAVTDTLGVARITSWTLRSAPGGMDTLTFLAPSAVSSRFRATLGAPVVPVDSLALIAGPPDTSNFASGVRIGVRAYGPGGIPAVGATINWKVMVGGGSVISTTPTDSLGESFATWIVSVQDETNTLEITAGSAPPLHVTTYSYQVNGKITAFWRVSPDTQTGQTLRPVPIPPRVQAVDSLGHGVPGIWIRVAPQALQGGYVAEDSLLTDANGEIEVTTWVLGSTPRSLAPNDAYILHFEGPGANANYYAAATAYAGPTAVSIVEPAPGSFVGDAFPVAAVVASTSGISSVVAEVGDSSWPMAFVAARQRWEATIPLKWAPRDTLLLTIHATNTSAGQATSSLQVIHQATAPAPMMITMETPNIGAIVRDTMQIALTVGGTRPISNVTATYGGLLLPLTFASPKWVGTLPLFGVPDDSLELVITATDVEGAAEIRRMMVEHNHPPKPRLIFPLDHTVADPSLYVEATCEDTSPSGCTQLNVFFGSASTVTSGTNSVATTVNILGHEGEILAFHASGQQGGDYVVTQPERTVYVETTPTLTSITRRTGLVVAYDGTRVLWRRVDPDSTTALVLGNADGSGAQVSIPTNRLARVTAGYLFPGGAAFHWVRHNADGAGPGPSQWLTYFPGGAPITVAVDSENYRITGKYLYIRNSGARVDMSTGASAAIPGIGSTHPVNMALSMDGFVAWVDGTGAEVRLWNGTTVQVISPAKDSGRHFAGVKIGTAGVTYGAVPDQVCCTPLKSILRHYAIGAMTTTFVDSIGTATAMNGGWTLFSRTVAGVQQFWTRSPTGVFRQITTFAATSQFVALSETGQVVVKNGNRRYWIGTATTTPVDVGSANFGEVAWSNGKFREVVGLSAFDVDP